MSEVLRHSANAIRFALVAILGAALAAALYQVWDLDTRWFVVAVGGIVAVALSMCLVSVFSDFVLTACLFALPVMSFHKWFWPDRYSEEERGNLVYSGVLGIGLIDFVVVGLYFSWFYRVFVTREQKVPRFNWVDSAILWFVLANVIASIGSSAPDLALGSVEYLLKFVLFYFYVSRNLSARFVPWMLAAFGVTIVLQAVLGSIQFSTGKWLGIALDKGAGGSELSFQYSVPGLEGIYRATGTCYDSHSLGHFVGLMLPFPLVLCFTPRLRWPFRLICAVVSGLAGMTIVFTFSRSSWMAVAISLSIGIVLIIVIWQERQVIPALAAAVVLLAGASPFVGSLLYKKLVDSPAGLLTTRYDQYWVALAIIEKFPILGHGPGNWFESLQRYDYLWLEDILPVHNVLLWLTADVGILGVTGYLAIFATAAARLLPILRHRRDLPARLAMATFLALVTTLLDGVTDPTFRDPNVFTMFWLLIALSVAIPELHHDTGATFMVPQRPHDPQPLAPGQSEAIAS